MANRTVKDAQSVKGTNPQHLVEKIIRSRVYDCKYWKEECFALTGLFAPTCTVAQNDHVPRNQTAELLVDKAMVLDHIGGVFGGNVKPTDFICLVLKMLQIQPSKDIIIEFIKNPDYK